MGRTRKGALKDRFKEETGRDLGKKVEQEILNPGSIDCHHPHILYIDNEFDGQTWWCDDCPRHVKINYSPGFKIKFPGNALISTPNPRYGGENFYAFRSNAEGEVKKGLRKDEWVRRIVVDREAIN